jgi:uncharacterized protein (TIGR02145 family)
MKRSPFTLFILSVSILLGLTVCEKDNQTDPYASGENIETGFLEIIPGIEISTLKSTRNGVVDSFKVEIYNSTDLLIQEFNNLIDVTFPVELPVGTYYVIMHSDNQLPAAFSNPYYEGQSDNFDIVKGSTSSVSVNAQLANVKVTVEYSAATQADFTGFLTVVSTGTDSLLFADQDTIPGFFEVTPLSIRAQLLFPGDGGLTDTLILTGSIPSPQPREHLLITVNASLNAGGVNGITLTVDESTIPVPVNIGDTASTAPISGNFIDVRDGTEYTTVQIGNQVWMAENLAFLPQVHTQGDGSSNTSRYYVYGFLGTDVNAAKSTANYQTFGVLYNWPAAMDETFLGSGSSSNPSGVQGVCPSGWHLPSQTEYQDLLSFIQTDDPLVASGTALKATNGWGVNGTDNYGFTALPGGRRLNDGSFVELGSFGYWWTTQSVSSQDAQFRFMNSSAFVNSDLGFKTRGMSVRCVQD